MSTPDTTVHPLFHVNGVSDPWGDYGHALTHGTTDGRDDDGTLRLERAGPFVPPIFVPGAPVVVTDEGRGVLQASGLTGLVFRPARLVKAVEIDWHTWDRNGDPHFYPEGGEPGGYVEQGRHAPDLAAAMPRLWEVTTDTGHLQIGDWDSRDEQLCLAGGGPVQDWYLQGRTRHVLCSLRARTVLLEHFARWLHIKGPGKR